MNSVGQIIALHRKKKGISQPELAAMLEQYGYDLTNKAISKWENGSSEPSVTLFLKLCKLLDITDMYGEFYGENPSNPLSQLNEDGQQKVIEYADLLSQSPKYKRILNIIPFTRTLRLYDNRISAGTGNYLTSEEFEEIEVGEEVPQSADYGLRITGDSMEPQFINGQVVWVHQQPSVSNGEIGIFYLNGDAFIKKLQDDENGLYLISLNKKYQPIPVKDNDTFKIFGRVVG